jgi:cytochrome c biogenesis protein CcdA
MGTQFDDAPRKKLGSLAQAARGTHLNQIRGILFIVGVLTIIVNLISLATLREQATKLVDKEITKQRNINPGFRVDPVRRQQTIDELVRLNMPLAYIFVGVGVLYLVFGLTVHQYPVPVTVIALVIYVAAAVIVLVLDPEKAAENLGRGLWFKVFIIAAMIGAIKTAITYERERKEAREELAYDYE